MQTNVTYWLDETVKRYPQKIGFCDENISISFKNFREEALKVATVLALKGIFKSPVAVYMDKCVDEIISFIGIAYSGNFYSPIDVDMPISRAEKIIEVFEPKIIITKKVYMDNIASQFQNAEIICMEDIKNNEYNAEIVFRNRDKCCDKDLLYVLFTSGSTGIPKGVTICHQSVIDYIDWVESEFEMDETIVFGNQAPFYFDNSIFDIYTTIKCGARMNVIPHKLFSWPKLLLEYIDKNGINTILWVPSALVLVSKMKALPKINLKGKLKKIFFCGEVMSNKHLNEWRKNIPDALYANLYGPTELTDVCTYYIVNRQFSNNEPLPIGKPVRNTDIIILNEQDKEAGKGENGELCVRGTSLSLGYYRNPEKTKQVFTQNPLNPNYMELIYRTGDIVKLNEYDEIMYIGRKDFQIKHMGHRIELGEIETAMLSLDEIAVCCCLYDEEKDKIIAVIEGCEEIARLNEKLIKLIPEYMIPNKYVYLEKIPLNINGKVDRVKIKEIVEDERN